MVAENTNVSATKMPLVNNFIVSGDEFDDFETQKKALAVQQNANEKLNITLSVKIEEYNKHRHELDIREDAIREKELEVRNMYYEQIHLNEDHEALRERFSALNERFQEVRYLEEKNSELNQQIMTLNRNNAEIKKQYEKRLSEKGSEILSLKEVIKESESTISEMQIETQNLRDEVNSKKSFIDILYEICEFLANKLNLCFDEILDLRIKGYSLNHIINRKNNNIER